MFFRLNWGCHLRNWVRQTSIGLPFKLRFGLRHCPHLRLELFHFLTTTFKTELESSNTVHDLQYLCIRVKTSARIILVIFYTFYISLTLIVHSQSWLQSNGSITTKHALARFVLRGLLSLIIATRDVLRMQDLYSRMLETSFLWKETRMISLTPSSSKCA